MVPVIFSPSSGLAGSFRMAGYEDTNDAERLSVDPNDRRESRRVHCIVRPTLDYFSKARHNVLRRPTRLCPLR